MKFLALLILIISLHEICAQNNNLNNHKWEIGFDLRAFLDSSYHIKESLLFKYHINDSYKYRLRIGGYYEKVDDKPSFTPDTNYLREKLLKLYLSFGLERKIASYKFITISAGADVFANYRKFDSYQRIDQRIMTPNGEEWDIYNDYEEIKSGINVFLSCEAQIYKNLFFSIESFFQFAYRHQDIDFENYYFKRLNTTSYVHINRFIVATIPFSSLNIIYKI